MQFGNNRAVADLELDIFAFAYMSNSRYPTSPSAGHCARTGQMNKLKDFCGSRSCPTQTSLSFLPILLIPNSMLLVLNRNCDECKYGRFQMLLKHWPRCDDFGQFRIDRKAGRGFSVDFRDGRATIRAT